jgi:lysyl-tRNA synthetase class I
MVPKRNCRKRKVAISEDSSGLDDLHKELKEAAAKYVEEPINQVPKQLVSKSLSKSLNSLTVTQQP